MLLEHIQRDRYAACRVANWRVMYVVEQLRLPIQAPSFSVSTGVEQLIDLYRNRKAAPPYLLARHSTAVRGRDLVVLVYLDD